MIGIRDAHGNNDTSADHVSGLLKTQLLALLAQIAPNEFQKQHEDEFHIPVIASIVNVLNNFDQYYAWNLRYSRALSIWMLETNNERKQEIKSYLNEELWPHTKDHQCGWIASVRSAMVPHDLRAKSILKKSLEDLSFKPLRNWSSPYIGQTCSPNIIDILLRDTGKYVVPPHLRRPTQYSTWAKEPWDVNNGEVDKAGRGEDTGLAYLLAYWCGRYFSAL